MRENGNKGGGELNRILRVAGMGVKSYLTHAAPQLKLVFKEGIIESICMTKGWWERRKNKPNYADMARALGITRAYMCMLAKRRVSVSHQVITRLAYLMNNFDKWHIYYDVVDAGPAIPSNHPIWNMEKYKGTVPYDEHSLAAEFRGRDHGAEKKSKKST